MVLFYSYTCERDTVLKMPDNRPIIAMSVYVYALSPLGLTTTTTPQAFLDAAQVPILNFHGDTRVCQHLCPGAGVLPA